MKKIVLSLMAIAACSLSGTAANGKVTIKHNGNIIEISKSALNAHLSHGDEIMVLYQGNWITLAEYQIILGNNEAGVIV